ncbi:MAG: hypothetical protein MK554_15145, partial [Planctomycetes bacterium]|nr:hypothetical protein [Planctomycetota bacterium]
MDVGKTAGCTDPIADETSRTGFLETLAGLAGSRLLTSREQTLAWDPLDRGFGADAALVIRKMEGGAWQCLHNWGFIDIGAPSELWQAEEEEPGEAGSASVWSRRTTLAWAKRQGVATRGTPPPAPSRPLLGSDGTGLPGCKL